MFVRHIIFSVLGMIALCGMVVNGGFVLAMTRNRYLARGVPLKKATSRAARSVTRATPPGHMPPGLTVSARQTG